MKNGTIGLAPCRIRGARGREARHRAGLGDAFLEDLTVRAPLGS